MKQLRNNVFETNSSSTHSICISKEESDNLNIPNHITIVPNDYGWCHDCLSTPEEKLSYLYSGILECDECEYYFEKLKEDLEKLNISYDIEYGYGGIDHGYELQNFIQEVCSDTDKLKRYLFNDKSAVYTGNDGCDDDKCKCCIAYPYEWDDNTNTLVENTRQDKEHFEYYFKGN